MKHFSESLRIFKGKVGLFPATLLLGANLSVSLAVLMQLNLTTQVLGACALFPVAIYPAVGRLYILKNWITEDLDSNEKKKWIQLRLKDSLIGLKPF